MSGMPGETGTGWINAAVTIAIAVPSAIVSALMTRSKDMERVASLEARSVANKEAIEDLRATLIRIEEKIDRMAERITR